MPTDYKPQYRDPRWQKRRLEIMQRDGFKCVCCGSDSSTLTVHHAYYVPGRNIWAYPDFALKTLCKLCHEPFHHQDVENEWDEPTEWEKVIINLNSVPA